jgi:hypothetical protein
MKSFLFAAAFAFTVAACTTTTGPTTAWGKEGMNMKDYRYDGVQCAVIAANYDPQNNGSNTAGGINGQNGSAQERPGDSAAASGPSTGASGGAFPTGGSGVYRDMANPDMVQRAATQQRAREMATQRARTLALKGCLTERGYKEFQLTAEQRAHLATLPEGSDERREYLFKLGADPAVLSKQPAVKSGS